MVFNLISVLHINVNTLILFFLNFLGSLEHIMCTVNCKFIKLDQPDKNGFCFYLLHKGHHEHQKPIQNKPFNNEKDMFKKRISTAPDIFG